MKCFMHPNVEATSVCKKCGKAMCIDCSSYTDHSGMCPVCKKEEYETELTMLSRKLQKNTSSIVINTILIVLVTIFAIIMAITADPSSAIILIADIVCAGIILKRVLNRKPIKQRIEYLTGEIAKINGALNKGTKLI